ncbi:MULTISPECIES: glycosyltransferase [unclassified Micromonospora]|uniref:glycosyltransferase n=1 Tax=unclassified Micromonospora TaxID=2617518 RepID=UPI003A874A93
MLTTREKDWWWSLQEIIPAVEGVWAGIGRSQQEKVRILCVPLPPEIERWLLDSASRLKRVVLTTVTPETVKAALLLRTRLRADTPMTLYVHGDSTEGFHAFGALADVLTERDTFVVSCEAEATATRYCFPNARISLIPFPLVDQFKADGRTWEGRRTTIRLAYVGRVSEQKNLHTLLFALWILRTFHDHAPRLTLDVYGGEDNLGSPNMGLKFPNYGTFLRRLTESLGLGGVVRWHGPKPRDWLLYDLHPEPHILVSPTLHSDENFGSSILASLVNGHQVVTTAWGGHLEFQDGFPQQLTLVPVHRSTMGPVVHPILLANAILEAVKRLATVAVEDAALDRARAQFTRRTVAMRTLDMLARPDGDPVPLSKSPIQKSLDERRSRFGGTRKIYENYEDSIAQVFFEAYGMKEALTFEEESSYLLAPWTSYANQVLRVADPHRGHQRLRLDATISDPRKVMMCPSMDTCRLSESLLMRLVTQGYAFPLPSAQAGARSVPRTR